MNARILTAVVICFAVVSLPFTSQAQSRSAKRKVLQTQSRTMVDEANDRARSFFDQRFTRCGDSVFTNVWTYELQAYRVLQFKNGDMSFDSTQRVTNAERLNGIEWKGSFGLFATAHRLRNTEGRWEPWEDFDRGLARWYFGVIKTTSGWQVNPDRYSTWNNFSKANCSVSSNGEVVVRDPNDLSDTYGYLKPYIFNKKTLIIFTTPEQFFADSGRTSFDGLKCEVVTRLPTGLHFVDGRALTPAEVARIERGQ